MCAERTDSTSFTNLRFSCAATGKLVDYEVPGDARTLKDLWSRTLLRSCCHCGKVHRFDFRSAYVAGVLADFGAQPPQPSDLAPGSPAARLSADVL
jgi:hypothetical protein